MFCKHCKSMMKRVFRFQNGKSYKLYRCPRCHSETKPIPYFFNDLEIRWNKSKTANKQKKKQTKKRGK